MDVTDDSDGGANMNDVTLAHKQLLGLGTDSLNN